jgi:hypothetical protein
VLPLSFQLSSHVKSMSINVICAGNVQLTGSSTGLGKVIYNQGVCNVGVQPGFLSLAICRLCKLCLRFTSSSSTWQEVRYSIRLAFSLQVQPIRVVFAGSVLGVWTDL